jgi:hypothetical protein
MAKKVKIHWNTLCHWYNKVNYGNPDYKESTVGLATFTRMTCQQMTGIFGFECYGTSDRTYFEFDVDDRFPDKPIYEDLKKYFGW